MFVQLVTVCVVYLCKTCNMKREWSFEATLIMKPEVAAPLVPTSMLHILWTTLLSTHINIISLSSWSSRDCFRKCFPMKTLCSLLPELENAVAGSPVPAGWGGLLLGQFVLSFSTPSWIAGWYVTVGAMQWLRPSVTGPSIWSSVSNPRLVHIGFMVDKSALGQVFFLNVSFLPCQYHSTNAQYSFIHLPPMMYNLSN